MISEFQQLAKKIDQLAELVQAMRSENTELRRRLAEAVASNDELRGRIQEAHERVSTVLQHAPFAEEGVEKGPEESVFVERTEPVQGMTAEYDGSTADSNIDPSGLFAIVSEKESE